ncbi:MAG: transaldolase [Micrococcales bacterium]|nr:MAG: transaldolase [Micrococcales bacterium]PIE27279.1 MAG: transaldolase [Micrococcales bacterium]
MTADKLAALAGAGVSIWLDDLSREMLRSGDLQQHIDQDHVSGVTTNPTIFAAALAAGDAYRDQVATLAAAGTSVTDTVFALTTDDVRDACDSFVRIHRDTGGVDGRVSIEVDPTLARDTEGTIAMARHLWSTIDRPNLLVKIPATKEGLPAIRTAISEGISVNVTLIFSLQRYREVMDAYLHGLERAKEAGLDLSTIESVASFFVSRVDSEVDSRLERIGTDEALALRGKAAVANARLAYVAWQEVFCTARWQVLEEARAHPQRPLWASTGVKNESYSPTMYVDQLVAPQVVNTMPAKTMQAAAESAEISGNTIEGTWQESQQVLDSLEAAGVSYAEVTDQLEAEGVQKFEKSWQELLATVSDALARACTSDTAAEAGQ